VREPALNRRILRCAVLTGEKFGIQPTGPAEPANRLTPRQQASATCPLSRPGRGSARARVAHRAWPREVGVGPACQREPVAAARLSRGSPPSVHVARPGSPGRLKRWSARERICACGTAGPCLACLSACWRLRHVSASNWPAWNCS
jgi:hypothetical protein